MVQICEFITVNQRCRDLVILCNFLRIFFRGLALWDKSLCIETSFITDISDRMSRMIVFASSDTCGNISHLGGDSCSIALIGAIWDYPNQIGSQVEYSPGLPLLWWVMGSPNFLPPWSPDYEGILALTLVGEGRWSLADEGGEEIGESMLSGVSNSPSHTSSLGQSGSLVNGDPPGLSMLVVCQSGPSMIGLRSSRFW